MYADLYPNECPWQARHQLKQKKIIKAISNVFAVGKSHIVNGNENRLC